MRSPLNGIRGLELTTMITGPLAGMLLADLGAAVTKIENREHPTEGDVWRIKPPVFFEGERPGTMSPPPVIGEQTDKILAELGQAPEALIKVLRNAKVV